MQGYFLDGLKTIVYLIPLGYLIIRGKRLKLKYFWLLFSGLLLLFLGHLLDFFDEFGYVFPLQDFFEDVVGFTLGFTLLILAIYLEFQKK
ncbi:MAG: hypothetical protein KKH29_01360 [Candidatus Omnitrophica bacterium]|nr:hypothetical protein [Candidatus Omnitrophota bacterium]MBU4345959.1 hypothetical protein [Candidatus Omnitrophota bacterium]MBU4472705.1 hypothetical protein [Candidatus Omnitrophota bacterium]MCG2705987.1 hypothetical protein [Candidatus Omnitrophota bacterium]